MRTKPHFEVLHQKVDVYPELKGGTLAVMTELTMIPRMQVQLKEDSKWFQDAKWKTIGLNFPLLDEAKINAISIDGLATSWKHRKSHYVHDNFTLQSVRDLTNYKLLYNTDVQDVKLFGELMIKVPQGIELKKIQSHDAETLDSVFVPVVVRVEYSLRDPSDGISFVHPRAARDPKENPRKRKKLNPPVGQNIIYGHHMFTYNTSWLPCYDGLPHSNTWEFNFFLEKGINAICVGDRERHEDGEAMEEDDEEETKLQQIHFSVPKLRAAEVGFAIGPFQELPDPTRDEISYYYFAPYADKISSSTTLVAKMIRIMEKRIGSAYPTKELSFVFVDDCYDLCIPFTGVLICSTKTLHSKSIIDQYLENVDLFSWNIAYSWMRHVIRISNIGDIWIQLGFAMHFQDCFERKVLGNNEVEHRRAEFRLYLPQYGPNNHPSRVEPLDYDGYQSSEFVVTNRFIRKKAWATLKTIETLTGVAIFEKTFKEAVASYYSGVFHIWDTPTLEKLFIESYGNEVSDIFKRHIYSGWYPHLKVKYQWQRKGRHLLTTERVIERKGRDIHNFDCNLRLIFHELETEVRDFARVERKPKAMQYPSQSKAPVGSKAEIIGRNKTSLRFLRVDPNYEIIARIEIQQAECHSIEQLEGMSDIKADVKRQLEALTQLRQRSHRSVSEALMRCIEKTENFWRVRADAADVLASSRDSRTMQSNCDSLIRFFKSKPRYDSTCTHLQCNDFSDWKEYLFQCSFVQSLANCCFDNFMSRPEVVRLIMDLLELNDNTGNVFCDSGWIAALLRAAGKFQVQEEELRARLINLVMMHQKIDDIMPSHRFVIRRAALLAVAQLQINGQLSKKYNFLKHFGIGSDGIDNEPEDVRLAAFEAIVMIAPQKKENIIDLLKIIKKESLPGARVQMINIWRKVWARFMHWHVYNVKAKSKHYRKRRANDDVGDSKREYVERKGAAANVDPVLTFTVPDMDFLNCVDPNTGKSPEVLQHMCQQIWDLLLNPRSERERVALYRLWEALFGNRDAPIHCTKQQRRDSSKCAYAAWGLKHGTTARLEKAYTEQISQRCATQMKRKKEIHIAKRRKLNPAQPM